MDFSIYYKIAKDHKDNHPSCGGEPYKSGEKLFGLIKDFSGAKILEIGTAVGYTTFILQNKKNFVDTIEFHKEHIEIAKENLKNWVSDISKINFLEGDAKDILNTLEKESYDIIFFDGYGVKNYFYKDFDELLKAGGLMIVANSHLKSTEKEFFNNLSNEKWEKVDEFDDTNVYKKLC